MDKKILGFAFDLCVAYAKYDSCNNEFYLNTNEIPSFKKEEFAGMIIANDDDIANECTGYDNKMFEKKMLPALINILKNGLDKEKEMDFISNWKDGVVSYTEKEIQRYIDEAISIYNENKDSYYEAI